MTFVRRRRVDPAREQWERVERWYGRLFDRGVPGWHAEDFSLVFLQQLWNMRDWLVASRLLKQEDVEVVFADPDLRLCRDIANAAKHLDLSDAGIDNLLIMCAEYDGADGSRLVVLADGTNHDVLDLCARGYGKVRTFLASKGWQLPLASRPLTFKEILPHHAPASPPKRKRRQPKIA